MNRKSAALTLVTVVAVMALALGPGALAERGGNRPSGPGGGGSGATMTFDPSAVAVGQAYRVNGKGFRANTWVTVGAHYADTTWWNSQQTDGEGNFSLPFTATSSGEVLHEAKEMGNNGRLRLQASETLSVAPAS